MITHTITIKNATGLHTRPGQRFVKEAQKYECDITITKEEKTANAKSLLKIMKLGISQGDSITLEFNGAQEEEAAKELLTWLENLEE